MSTTEPTAADITAVLDTAYRVSSYSGGQNCVGVADAGPWVGIHDTKAPEGRGTTLITSKRSFVALIDAVRTGRIAHPHP